MNALLPVLPALVTAKPEVLNTIPVGVPWSLPGAAGIVTTSDCGLPRPSYNVDTPVRCRQPKTKPFGVAIERNSPTVHEMRIEDAAPAGCRPTSTLAFIAIAVGGRKGSRLRQGQEPPRSTGALRIRFMVVLLKTGVAR